MSMPQQKFREIVFQLLYGYDMGRSDENEIIRLLASELEVSKKSVREALVKAKHVIAKQSELDQLIAEMSISYDFERIHSVERNILRLGIYELLFDDEIPPKVAITEALRLARKFATVESAAFVNAIIDNIYKKQEGINIDPSLLTEAIQKLAESEYQANKVSAESIKKEGVEEENE